MLNFEQLLERWHVLEVLVADLADPHWERAAARFHLTQHDAIPQVSAHLGCTSCDIWQPPDVPLLQEKCEDLESHVRRLLLQRRLSEDDIEEFLKGDRAGNVLIVVKGAASSFLDSITGLPRLSAYCTSRSKFSQRQKKNDGDEELRMRLEAALQLIFTESTVTLERLQSWDFILNRMQQLYCHSVVLWCTLSGEIFRAFEAILKLTRWPSLQWPPDDDLVDGLEPHLQQAILQEVKRAISAYERIYRELGKQWDPLKRMGNSEISWILSRAPGNQQPVCAFSSRVICDTCSVALHTHGIMMTCLAREPADKSPTRIWKSCRDCDIKQLKETE